MTIYVQTITGTSGDDMLTGGSGNDHITSTGGHDEVKGNAGDDYMYVRGHGGELAGGGGNDIHDAGKIGFGQYHFYAGAGDDIMRMDLTNKEGWGHQQLHAYGNEGNDTFGFTNVQGAEIDTMVRIDDFSSTRDQLVIEGQVIDFGNLPAGMRVVSYLGQQWLHINNDTSAGNADPLKGDILIDLDGGRQMPDFEEVHFSPFPTDADALPTVAYVDDNYVPHQFYGAREASLNKIFSSAASVSGTEGADYIYGFKDSSLAVGMTSAISGLGGDDVIEAGSGHDTVDGGAGNDIIAGGLDKDILLGGTGNDRLLGGSENDRLQGQPGNDTLDGGRGTDEAVFSGAWSDYTITSAGGVFTVTDNRAGSPDGTDTLVGVERLRFSDQVMDTGLRIEPNVLTGNSSNNVLTGNGDPDVIYGRENHDTLNGMGGNDQLLGEQGVDTLEGGTGADEFIFNAPNESRPGAPDTVLDFVTGEDDIVVSAIDANTLLAGHQAFVLGVAGSFAAGEIRQRVSEGNLFLDFNTDADLSPEMIIQLKGVTSPLAAGDFEPSDVPENPSSGPTDDKSTSPGLTGDSGSNILTGTGGADTIKGFGGNDVLNGGAGADWLQGGDGQDTLVGGLGNDDLSGGRGKDILRGQGGADNFVFTSLKDSGPSKTTRDTITDFGGKDEIDLHAIDAVQGRSNQAFSLDRDSSFDAGEIRQTKVAGGVLLEMNVDHDAKAEMSIFLKGMGGTLSGGDFVL